MTPKLPEYQNDFIISQITKTYINFPSATNFLLLITIIGQTFLLFKEFINKNHSSIS